MTRKQQPPPSPELRQARQQLQQWRQRKQPHERIPEPLWKRAVELVATHGLNPVSRLLNLDYYSLKKRVQQAENAPAALSRETAFLELPPAVPALRECVIEHDTSGTLRVRLRGYPAHEIAIVTRSLREDR